MKYLSFAALALIMGTMTAVPVSAHAETTHATVEATEPVTTVGTPDDFIHNAAISNMFEIESSKLALTKAHNPKVKEFAQMMVTDHSGAGAGLKAAVAGLKTPHGDIPTVLDETHQAKLDELKKLSGAEFDTAYIDAQVEAHKAATTLFEGYGENVEDDSLKAFAVETLPKLIEHQKIITNLDEADTAAHAH